MFFTLASIALVANAIGDTFNLLQPTSKFAFVEQRCGLAHLPHPHCSRGVDPPCGRRKAGDRQGRWLCLARVPDIQGIGMSILFLASLGHLGRPAIALATITAPGRRRAAGADRAPPASAVNTARFRSLIDQTWDLIAVIEADLRIAYITPSSERVLGYLPGLP